MGQYYIAVILGPQPEHKGDREFIRAWVSSYSYGCGAKLMEHSYIGNGFTNSVERLLSPEGAFWKSRFVWAGDYADPEEEDKENTTLHAMTNEEHEGKEETPNGESLSCEYSFIVNHTKKQYVDKSKVIEDSRGFRIHPLPLLTAEGNGRGGGDYSGSHEDLVGSWARDVISVEKKIPNGYTLLDAAFHEPS